MKDKETRLIEIILALLVILLMMAISSIGVRIYLDVKNDGQNINKILIGINK